MRGERIRLVHLARARQGLYRLLGAVFLPPQAESAAVMQAAAGLLERDLQRVCSLSFVPVWREFVAVLERVPPTIDRYLALFAASADAVPLCASRYAGADAASQAAVVAAVQDTYQRAGLRARAQEPDHLATELEFLSFLCGQEVEARLQRAHRAVRDALERQLGFLDEHLCLWLPLLADRLARREPHGLYTAAAAAAWAIAVHDRDLLALLVEWDPPGVYP